MTLNTATSLPALLVNESAGAKSVNKPADALLANERTNPEPVNGSADTGAPLANEPARAPPPRRRLLRTHEVSELYGIPVAQLEILRHRGGGSRFVKLGRAVYYRPEDVEAWIAANVRKSTSDPGSAGTIA